MTEAEARRVCAYIRLGYSAWRIAELFEVPLEEVVRLKSRYVPQASTETVFRMRATK